MSNDILEVDHLIVGAGPAGASLACFLGKHGKCLNNTADIPDHLTGSVFWTIGLKGLIISSAPSSANTPRAHIINQPAMGKLAVPLIQNSIL
jgi:flavin-dependent dehydrogenase